MRYPSLIASLKQRAKDLFYSPTMRVVSGLAGGNLLATLIAIIGALVQARFVSPDELGYLRGFLIVSGYVIFLNLGLFDAVHRLYPYYMGKGQKEKAIAVAEIGQAWNVSMSVIISGVFIILAVIAQISGNWRAMLAWAVQALLMSALIYGGYLSATYRSGHEFGTVAKGAVISGFVNLSILPVLPFWPYVGLALRSSMGDFINMIYLHFHRPLHLRWRFSWGEWFDLVKQGLPVFIANYGSTTFWSVIESTIVLRFLGTPSLGLWSMSMALIEAINEVPQAIVAVYTPRVIELYGKTESVIACMRLSLKPMLWGLLAILLIIVAGFVALPLIVPMLMPKYIDAVPTMCLLLLILALRLLELPNSLLIAMGKRAQQNISVFVGLGCFILLAIATIPLGFGLVGVAVVTLIARVVKLIFIYGIIYLDPSWKRP